KALLAAADRKRLSALLRFAGGATESGASAAEMVATVNRSSRAEPGGFVWVAILFLAMVLAFLATITEVPGIVPGCILVGVLLILSCLLPDLRLVALTIGALVEAGILTRALLGEPRKRWIALLGFGGSVVILIVSAIRFAAGGAAIVGWA